MLLQLQLLVGGDGDDDECVEDASAIPGRSINDIVGASEQLSKWQRESVSGSR